MWLGPIIGCVLPLAAFAIVPSQLTVVRNVGRFFAGFCLIANGVYVAAGSFGGVGDCGEMLRTGTPLWVMLAFGAVTIPLGIYQWHGLGPLNQFINDTSIISRRMAYVTAGILFAVVGAGFVLSPR